MTPGTDLRAAVCMFDKRAGTLAKIPKGFRFYYDPAYLKSPEARPISFSMPLRAEAFESPRLFSFFEGLLPEGWLLDLTTTAAKIDKNDKFALLLHTGRDPVGAVSLRPLKNDEQ